MKKTTHLCVAAALSLTGLAAHADVPWKFEGTTNRVAAASAASAPTAGFVAHEVSLAAAPTWPDLIRHELTAALSPLTLLTGRIGSYLIVK